MSKLWDRFKEGLLISLMSRRGVLIRLMGSFMFASVTAAAARLKWEMSESTQLLLTGTITFASGFVVDTFLILIAGKSNETIQRELSKLDSDVLVDRLVKPNGQTVAAVKTLVRSVQDATPGEDFTGKLSVPVNEAATRNIPGPSIDFSKPNP